MRPVHGGYLPLGRFLGLRLHLHLHWSLLLSVLVLDRGRLAPGAWLGFVLVVLVHQLGHALAGRLHGLRALAIESHGLGGHCRWQGTASARARAAIAWSGVGAQLLLLGATLLVLGLGGVPRHTFGQDLASTLTIANAVIAALNLLPVAPLDGAEAWPLFGLLRERRRAVLARPSAQPFRLIQHLPRLEGGLTEEDLEDLYGQIERIRRRATAKARSGS
jgi:stage IV sporulation protein FB